MPGSWRHIHRPPNGMYIMVVQHSGDTGTISITLGSCRGHIISKKPCTKSNTWPIKYSTESNTDISKIYLYVIKKSLKLSKTLSEALILKDWRYNEQKKKHKNIEEKQWFTKHYSDNWLKIKEHETSLKNLKWTQVLRKDVHFPFH